MRRENLAAKSLGGQNGRLRSRKPLCLPRPTRRPPAKPPALLATTKKPTPKPNSTHISASLISTTPNPYSLTLGCLKMLVGRSKENAMAQAKANANRNGYCWYVWQDQYGGWRCEPQEPAPGRTFNAVPPERDDEPMTPGGVSDAHDDQHHC